MPWRHAGSLRRSGRSALCRARDTLLRAVHAEQVKKGHLEIRRTQTVQYSHAKLRGAGSRHSRRTERRSYAGSPAHGASAQLLGLSCRVYLPAQRITEWRIHLNCNVGSFLVRLMTFLTKELASGDPAQVPLKTIFAQVQAHSPWTNSPR
jgi:hypothetical protein